MRLPVIVGFGGIGPGGRSSGHHAYRRTVLTSLLPRDSDETVRATAAMMGLVHHHEGHYRGCDGAPIEEDKIASRFREQVLANTLIRRLGVDAFDPDKVTSALNFDVASAGEDPLVFTTRARELPTPLPHGWEVLDQTNEQVRIKARVATDFVLSTNRALSVKAAGQLPTGFDPGRLYNSRFHPKGLQMTIVAASDAVLNTGIPWPTVTAHVPPDEIAVYAASAMAQLDQYGTGGMLQARLRGSRISSKQLPLGLNTMPADFVNAYVLGNVGATGATAGACATFLYNLRAAVEDIQSGRRRVAIVGCAEAPLLPEVIEGYAAMSALATDENLCRLDGVDVPDHTRASRPFGENCGFVLAESAQYIVLFDDELALALGANIAGAIPAVFVNADGFKKSISSPGPGNYITMGKAAAFARALVGEDDLRQRSFIQAHGSSTPQNRTTESRIFDAIARAFGIQQWPVTAVKAFMGHSLAPASGDQLINALGVFEHELLPGIKTIDHIADDVLASRLAIAIEDLPLPGRAEIAFLNSKGFGGNNATGVVVSPRVTEALLKQRHGKSALHQWATRREATAERRHAYELACCRAPMQPIYRFGDALIDENEIEVDAHSIRLPGFRHAIDLDLDNPYDDMV